ncbi:Leucinerich repeats and immunoglobulinlike domains 3, partial [Caligus rogercresseyi]
ANAWMLPLGCPSHQRGRTNHPSPELSGGECYELDSERRVVLVRRRHDEDDKGSRKKQKKQTSDPRLLSSTAFYASHPSLPGTLTSSGSSPQRPHDKGEGPILNKTRDSSSLAQLPLLRHRQPFFCIEDSPPSPRDGGESVMNLSDLELAQIPFADDSSAEEDIYLESSSSPPPHKHNDTFTIHDETSCCCSDSVVIISSSSDSKDVSSSRGGPPSRGASFKFPNVYLNVSTSPPPPPPQD